MHLCSESLFEDDMEQLTFPNYQESDLSNTLLASSHNHNTLFNDDLEVSPQFDTHDWYGAYDTYGILDPFHTNMDYATAANDDGTIDPSMLTSPPATHTRGQVITQDPFTTPSRPVEYVNNANHAIPNHPSGYPSAQFNLAAAHLNTGLHTAQRGGSSMQQMKQYMHNANQFPQQQQRNAVHPQQQQRPFSRQQQPQPTYPNPRPPTRARRQSSNLANNNPFMTNVGYAVNNDATQAPVRGGPAMSPISAMQTPQATPLMRYSTPIPATLPSTGVSGAFHSMHMYNNASPSPMTRSRSEVCVTTPQGTEHHDNNIGTFESTPHDPSMSFGNLQWAHVAPTAPMHRRSSQPEQPFDFFYNPHQFHGKSNELLRVEGELFTLFECCMLVLLNRDMEVDVETCAGKISIPFPSSFISITTYPDLCPLYHLLRRKRRRTSSIPYLS